MEIIYLWLHCHHQNDSYIKMGIDESQFNVSVTGSDGQSHKAVSTNHNHKPGRHCLLYRRAAPASRWQATSDWREEVGGNSGPVTRASLHSSPATIQSTNQEKARYNCHKFCSLLFLFQADTIVMEWSG